MWWAQEEEAQRKQEALEDLRATLLDRQDERERLIKEQVEIQVRITSTHTEVMQVWTGVAEQRVKIGFGLVCAASSGGGAGDAEAPRG